MIEHRRSVQMKRIIILSLMGLSFLILPATLRGDTLTLLDGTTIYGVVVSRTATRVTFRDDQGVSRRYRTSQIESLELSSNGRMIRYNENRQDSRNNVNNDNRNNGNYDNRNNGNYAIRNNASYDNRNNASYDNRNNASYDNRNNASYDNRNIGNNNYSSRGDNQPEYLPAGTRLAILTNEKINSHTAHTNNIYSGQG